MSRWALLASTAALALPCAPAHAAQFISGAQLVSAPTTGCTQLLNIGDCTAAWAYGFDPASLDPNFATDSINDGGTNQLPLLPAKSGENYVGWHFGAGASPSHYTGLLADQSNGWAGPTVTGGMVCTYNHNGYNPNGGTQSAPYWLCFNQNAGAGTVDFSGVLMETAGGDCVAIKVAGFVNASTSAHIHDNKFVITGSCQSTNSDMIWLTGANSTTSPPTITIDHNSVDGQSGSDPNCVPGTFNSCTVFFVLDARGETAGTHRSLIFANNYLRNMQGRPVQSTSSPNVTFKDNFYDNVCQDGLTHCEIYEGTNNFHIALGTQSYQGEVLRISVLPVLGYTAMMYLSSGQTNNNGGNVTGALPLTSATIDGSLDIVNQATAGVGGHGLFATTYNSVVTSLTVTNSAIYANGVADCAINEASAGGSLVTAFTSNAAGTPGSGNFLNISVNPPQPPTTNPFVLGTLGGGSGASAGWFQPGQTIYQTSGAFVATTLTNQAYGSNSETMNPQVTGVGTGTIQFDGAAQNISSATTWAAAATIQNFTQSNNYSVKDLSAVTWTGINLTKAQGSVCHGVGGSTP